MLPLLEAGKDLKHPIVVGLDFPFVQVASRRFSNTVKLPKIPLPSGTWAIPNQSDDSMGGNAPQILSLEHDGAAVIYQAGNRPQNGGFARAVSADQGDDFAFQNRKRHPLQRPNAVVGHDQIADFQKNVVQAVRFAVHPTGPSPRYASSTLG